MLLPEQPGGKLIGTHPEFLNAWKYIERSLRLEAGKVHLLKRVHKETPALVIGLAHLCHFLIAVPKRHNRRILTVGRCTHDCILVNFNHLLYDFGRPARIPKPPSGHGIGFGKSINQYRPLFHPRHLSNTVMAVSRIGKLCVNFIAQDENILLNADFCDFFQVFLFHNGTCRIIREWKNQHFCFIGDGIQKFFRRQPELIFLLKPDGPYDSVRQSDTGRITYITGFRNNYFVARIQHSAECGINSLTAPDRQKYLGKGIVCKAEPSVKIPADFFTKRFQS